MTRRQRPGYDCSGMFLLVCALLLMGLTVWSARRAYHTELRLRALEARAPVAVKATFYVRSDADRKAISRAILPALEGMGVAKP